MAEIFAIAIDGPSGSGKSTAAKMIAKKLNITYVDTGAMYRAVGLYCRRKGIDTKDEASVVTVLDEINITFKVDGDTRRIMLNGEDVTDTIRTQDIGMAASDVGAIADVRKKLVKMQQMIAKEQSVVMDGRDIGTVVLKNAQIKIYLDATVEERTRRRIGELNEKGIISDFETIKKEIEERDYNDTHRKVTPLCKAEDAVYFVNDGMTVDETSDAIIKIVDERLGR
ncbi:MAG: (d)CMP kinase [Lachnospiraceae bacterium]|nr:(d)CMP kinase [Lachnospiraceae bacterium]